MCNVDLPGYSFQTCVLDRCAIPKWLNQSDSYQHLHAESISETIYVHPLLPKIRRSSGILSFARRPSSKLFHHSNVNLQPYGPGLFQCTRVCRVDALISHWSWGQASSDRPLLCAADLLCTVCKHDNLPIHQDWQNQWQSYQRPRAKRARKWDLDHIQLELNQAADSWGSLWYTRKDGLSARESQG